MRNFPIYMIIWTYTSISKALQGRKLGELEVNFGNKLGKFHRFLRGFDKFCENSTKWGTVTCKSTPLLIMALIWGFFSYIFAIAFQHFPSCTLISPYTFIRSSKKYPPYTFIWHYTFINFPKFSLLHVYLALHVYLEH